MNVEDYVINKKTNLGNRLGIDWKKLETLEKKLLLGSLKGKSLLNNTKDFKRFYDKVLIRAKQEGILVNPQPNTFYVLVEEVNPHPTIKGERYNFKEKAELYDYINAFWKERWITPVMELEIK